jgi:hypothetical protein
LFQEKAIALENDIRGLTSEVSKSIKYDEIKRPAICPAFPGSRPITARTDAQSPQL